MKKLFVSILLLGSMQHLLASQNEQGEATAIKYCTALKALDFKTMKSLADEKALKQIAYIKDESTNRPERYNLFLASVTCVSISGVKSYDNGMIKVYLKNLQVKVIKGAKGWKVLGTR